MYWALVRWGGWVGQSLRMTILYWQIINGTSAGSNDHSQIYSWNVHLKRPMSLPFGRSRKAEKFIFTWSYEGWLQWLTVVTLTKALGRHDVIFKHLPLESKLTCAPPVVYVAWDLCTVSFRRIMCCEENHQKPVVSVCLFSFLRKTDTHTYTHTHTHT